MQPDHEDGTTGTVVYSRHGRGIFRAAMLATAPISLIVVASWFGTYTFINTYYTRALGKSNAEWTLLTLWFNGSMILWPYVCVPVVSHLGHRVTVLLGTIVTALLYLLTAYAHSTMSLSIIMVLMAFVPSALAVAWIPMVIEAGKARPGGAIAGYTFLSTLIGSSALFFGGRLLALMGYRALFLTIAGLAALCIGAFYTASASLPAPPRLAKASLLSVSKNQIFRLLWGPFAFLMIAGISAEPFNFHTVNQLFPNLAHDLHGLSEGSISAIVALGRLPALASLVLLMRIVDDVNVTTFYGLGLLAAGLCVAGIGAAATAPFLVLLYCGYYLFHGVVWGTNVAAVNAAVEPEHRELALAIMMSLSTGATFAVGLVHNRLLAAGMSLPTLVCVCGGVAAAAGGTMVVYSFTRFANWSRPQGRSCR